MSATCASQATWRPGERAGDMAPWASESAYHGVIQTAQEQHLDDLLGIDGRSRRDAITKYDLVSPGLIPDGASTADASSTTEVIANLRAGSTNLPHRLSRPPLLCGRSETRRSYERVWHFRGRELEHVKHHDRSVAVDLILL